MRTSYLSVLSLCALVACSPEGNELDAPIDGIYELSPRRSLIRLSVDLRGVHPSEIELQAIEDDPRTYGLFVDRFLDDPRFVGRMKEVFNLSFRTRTGETFFDPGEAGIGFLDDETVADSLGDEPLAMVGHIIDKNLPWGELVTADYTLANPIVAAMWDVPYPDGESGWVKTAYDDGRPAVGVLSSTTLWTRYPSAGVNANRHRANMVSRIFLCDNYLSRPVSFGRAQVDALTTGDPNDVITNNEVCQSCHSTLDPLASHFYGFWWEIDGNLSEQTLYRPEDEELWRDQYDKSPAYYGVATTGLAELGAQLATDTRYYDCAVQTVFDGLTQREVNDTDWDELWTHRDAFEQSGYVIRDLVRSIVNSPEYKATLVVDSPKADRVETLKMVTPSQLEGIIEAKTGYRWDLGGRKALSRNVNGLGVLAGGIDSRFVTTPSYDPSIGMLYVQERLGQAAGWHVARHDLDPERQGDAILLKYVTLSDTPEAQREAFATQIVELYRDITGVPLPVPDDPDEAEAYEPPEVAELIRLWKQLYSVEASPESAWAGVVSVVLRDPMVLFY